MAMRKAGLESRWSLVFVEKFIEYTNDDGFVDRESFKITDDAKKQLFSELNLSSMRGSRPKGGMLSFEDISPKQLFYNSKEQRQVEELTSLLDEEHFQRIKIDWKKPTSEAALPAFSMVRLVQERQRLCFR